MDAREDHLHCIEGDPNLSQLPSDWEMVVADVSDSAAVIRMYSREAKAAYLWNEERGEIINPFFYFYFYFSLTCNCSGLHLRTKEHFWSLIAEFPSHHNTLPPNAEQEFSSSLVEGEGLLQRTSCYSHNFFSFSKNISCTGQCFPLF